MSEIEWFDYKQAVKISKEERESHLKKLVAGLKGKPKGTHDYYATGNLFLYGRMAQDGRIEVWECDSVRHTFDASGR